MIFLQGQPQALETLAVAHTPAFMEPLILRRARSSVCFTVTGKRKAASVWKEPKT